MHLLDPAIALAPKPPPPKQRTAITLSSDVLAPYVGNYEFGPQDTLKISRPAPVFGSIPPARHRPISSRNRRRSSFPRSWTRRSPSSATRGGAVTGLDLHQGRPRPARQAHPLPRDGGPPRP